MKVNENMMRFFLKTVFCCFVLMLSSCVEDLNFDQAGDLELTPAVAASLVNSTITQNQLVIGGTELSMPIEQTSLFTVFNNEQSNDNLERAVLRFDINNQFNRRFRIQFLFLDNGDNTTYGPVVLDIPENESNFRQEEEIIIANNPAFTNTRKVQVRIELLPSTDGSTIDVNVPASLIFKSAGTFYFRIN